MADNLPKTGVVAVVQDADKYFSTLDRMEQATAKTGAAFEKQAAKTQAASKAAVDATSKFNPFSKLMDKLDDQFGGVGKKIQSFASDMGIGGDKAAAFASSLGTTPAILLGVAAAAAVAVTAFVALGQRGAGFVGIAESFDRLNQAAGVDAVAALQRLRAASGGTVADFELLRLTNVALAGATGAFGRQFGEELPRLLEIARVQARATGQDVGFLFQSLITGIKRSSPMLIDNTGLVLKISEANAAMALSLGKSVEQLTAEEKQIAVLNATLAAGQTAITAFAGIQETAADKMARMNATITNILDTLAVGVQPAFGMWLDVLNRSLGFVQILTTALNPFISSLLEAGTAIFTGPITAIQALAEPVIKLTAFFLTFATVLLQPVLRAITTVFSTFGTAVQRIVDFVGGAFASIGLTFDTLALSVGVGAGAIIAAMGNAMLQAYNAVVAPVVLFIATAIADFLVGQSPPPKGPLSQIDKGGAATMQAWMEGFAGVSLEPVESVAAAVEATLGNVGMMALPQVEARLGVLDQALAPFNNQLEIIKANFEAISAPAQAALDAIGRQTEKAQAALAAGDIGAAERIRALDAQREMIEKAVDAQQQLVDQASVQQALAKAQQAPERALLAIQQARLKALETKKTPEAKAAAEAAGKGGAVATPEMAAGGGAAGGFDMGLPSVNDLISGQGAVDQMGADLGAGFTAGFEGSINQGTVAAFQENQRLIGVQTDRIGQANIGTRIADAFTGLGVTIGLKLQEASAVITDWIGSITDPAREGSVPYSFNALMNGDWSALTSSLTAPFSNLADNIGIEVQNLLGYFNDPANEAGITAGLQMFTDNLPSFLQPILQFFTDNWTDISAGIQTWIYDNFDPSNLNSIPGNLSLLPTRIGNALSALPDQFNDSVLVPIQDTVTNVGVAIGNFFVGTGEGTLSGMIDSGVAWFIALPGRIFTALAGVGAVFFAAVATPIIGGINVVIEGIENMINYALSALGTLIGSFAGIAEAVGMGDQVAAIQASLVAGINLPRVTLPSPPAAVMPAARTGGLFGVKTHRGEQSMVMNAGQRLSVFPAEVTKNLELIASVLGGGGGYDLPMSLAGGGGGGTSNTWNNSFNVNNPPSSGNFVQQSATLMSMKRGRV